ncbi:MAG: hypothetical protein IKK23_00430, partial [Bacteroidales bacterium]|nr:hypothetical protein [Bacteroidales bacterium]
MKHIIIPALCLLLISCNSRSTDNVSALDPNFEYAHLIPDSLRTPQQKEMVKTLYTAIEKYTTID